MKTAVKQKFVLYIRVLRPRTARFTRNYIVNISLIRGDGGSSRFTNLLPAQCTPLRVLDETIASILVYLILSSCTTPRFPCRPPTGLPSPFGLPPSRSTCPTTSPNPSRSAHPCVCSTTRQTKPLSLPRIPTNKHSLSFILPTNPWRPPLSPRRRPMGPSRCRYPSASCRQSSHPPSPRFPFPLPVHPHPHSSCRRRAPVRSFHSLPAVKGGGRKC